MPTGNKPDRGATAPAEGVSPHLLTLLKVEERIERLAVREATAETYLFERYRGRTSDWKRNLYYRLKPLIPRPLQIALRKKYARVQAKTSFPAWPIEPFMVRLIDEYLTLVMQEAHASEVYRIAPWPEGNRVAFAVTHDVELSTGLARALDLAEMERSYGIVSSWNIVPERYPIDRSVLDRLRAGGFEIGIHGLHHDGKLFNSQNHFLHAAAVINRYAREWGAEGFRSEATLRNPDWMPALEVQYDSSFPDTDPYEPQPGGCCTIWPYFIGNIVELPLTMPQDHTLFEILGQNDISIWKEKADWIVSEGGLVLCNIHPDYIFVGNRLRLYEEFLAHMRRKPAVWHALPRDVARWWRQRNASRLHRENGIPAVEGPAANRASIMRTSACGAGVHHELLYTTPEPAGTQPNRW